MTKPRSASEAKKVRRLNNSARWEKQKGNAHTGECEWWEGEAMYEGWTAVSCSLVGRVGGH